MRKTITELKSYAFSLKIISVYKQLTIEKKEFILSKQLLRSGTAIGALVREATHSQSKKDFLNKMNISLKEANETVYWIDLLHDSDYISDEIFKDIYPLCEELVELLTSIVKTTKQNFNIS